MNEAASVRRPSVWAKTWQWLRRRPRAALTALALLGLVGLLVWHDRVLAAQLKQEQARLFGLAVDRVQGDLLWGHEALEQENYPRAAQHFDKALAAIASVEPRLNFRKHEVQQFLEQCRLGLQTQATRRAAWQKLADFQRRHDDALFHASGLTRPDRTVDADDTRAAARAALAMFGVTPTTHGPPDVDPDLRPKKGRVITIDCCQLLLVWAEVEFLARPESKRQEAPAARALRLLDRAAELGHADTVAYHLVRARCLDQQGHRPAAAKERRRAAALPPDSATDCFLRGSDWFFQRNESAAALDHAIRWFQQALAIEPGHLGARYYLAACYLHRPVSSAELFQANHVVAEAYLTSCLVQSPDRPFLYAVRGEARIRLADSPAAIAAAVADADRAVDLAPDEAALHYQAARIHAQAVAQLDQLAANQRGQRPAYRDRALQLLAQALRAVQPEERRVILRDPRFAPIAQEREFEKLYEQFGKPTK